MNNKLLASSIERPLLAQWVPDSGANWVRGVPVLVQTGCQILVTGKSRTFSGILLIQCPI